MNTFYCDIPATLYPKIEFPLLPVLLIFHHQTVEDIIKLMSWHDHRPPSYITICCIRVTCYWKKQKASCWIQFLRRQCCQFFWHTVPERCPCPRLCSPVQCSCLSALDQQRGGRPCPLRSPRYPVACLKWAAPCWNHTCRWTGIQKLCSGTGVERARGWFRQTSKKVKEKRKKKVRRKSVLVCQVCTQGCSQFPLLVN